jgi:hypothetical protein
MAGTQHHLFSFDSTAVLPAVLLHHAVRHLTAHIMRLAFGVLGGSSKLVGQTALLLNAWIVFADLTGQELRFELPSIGHFSQ